MVKEAALPPSGNRQNAQARAQGAGAQGQGRRAQRERSIARDYASGVRLRVPDVFSPVPKGLPQRRSCSSNSASDG